MPISIFSFINETNLYSKNNHKKFEFYSFIKSVKKISFLYQQKYYIFTNFIKNIV